MKQHSQQKVSDDRDLTLPNDICQKKKSNTESQLFKIKKKNFLLLFFYFFFEIPYRIEREKVDAKGRGYRGWYRETPDACCLGIVA